MPLLLLGGAGCAWQDQNVAATSWLSRARGNPIDGPHAILEVALIERPVGDRYINRELWDSVDELVVDLDRRSTLDDNGLRVGQLVGSPPDGFQGLLLSKRSCSNPHAMMIPPGRTLPIYLGPVLGHTSYEMTQGAQKAAVNLDQARFCLEVTPLLTPEGKTKLTFTPKVEHGEALLPFQASPQEGDWTLRVERPNKKYAELGWEITLTPNQYLIVGARLDRADSLGLRAFVQDEGGVQRLLVIRGVQAVAPGGDGAVEEYLRSQSPPLALQATATPVARAQKR